MKKVLYGLFLIFIVSSLTGCGKKRVLECKMEQTESGIQMSQVIKATFNGNKVNDLLISVDAELDEKYADYKSTYIKAIESSFDSYKSLKGIDITSKETEKGFKVILSANLKKMDKKAKEKLSIVDEKADFNKSKKDFEKEGYTCK